MRHSYFFSIVVVGLAVAAIGCGGGRGRRPASEVDSGPGMMMDGSTPPGTDSGVPPGTDAGTPPGTDAGTPPGTDSGVPPRIDAGGGRTCEGSIVTTLTGQCNAASITCATDCGSDGACIDTCLMGGGPDCDACASNNIIACANENGCQGLWDVYNCCYVDNCAMAADPATCLMTTCGTPRMAYQSCLTGLPMTAMCGAAWYDCR